MTKFNEQQERAIECKTNCIVSAGAGSGKTEVLSERFMRLVKEGSAHCDEILTITFTRKATAEMKSRIHERLMKEGLSEELRRFHQAYISTVDGFCSTIAKTDCQRYGLPSDFAMFDEADYVDFISKLAVRFLNDNVENEAVKYLITSFGCNGASNMLCQMAEKIFNIVEDTDAKKNAASIIEFNNKQYERFLREAISGCDCFLDALENIEGTNKNYEIVKQMKDCIDNKDFHTLASLSIKGTYGSTESKAVVKELREGVEKPIEDLLIFAEAVNQSNKIEKLCELVSEYEKLVNSEKRRLGKITFTDVMKLSIDILSENKTVRETYKKKFKYIMIDEFQDNNDDYRKLLYLLSEKSDCSCNGIPTVETLNPNKIFLVGDEKQSIYRFRGADVTVFKGLSSEIGQIMELSVNYRSQKKLVDSFNILFKNVMNNNGQNYEADFKELGYKDNSIIDSKILFHNFYHPRKIDYSLYPYENCATPVQSEAYSIANLIDRMLNTDDFLIEKENKAVRPQESDIAILLQKSSRQCDYEKALRLKGIKYSITEARSLLTEALFNDFYNIFQLCLYPYDKLTLIAFLKSPFCRLSDEQIFSLDMNQLPENIQSIIDSVKTKLSEGSLTAALDYVYYDLGYRNFLISNPGNSVYCEHYDYLYALFAKFESQGKNISQVLEYIRPLLGSSAKLMELDTFSEETDGVKIMTIHKSKGLGFPIVIVAGMETENRSHFDYAQVCKTDGTIFFNCIKTSDNKFINPLYVVNKDMDKLMECAELKRLLYVAATRAKCHLIFSANMIVSENSESTTMIKMLLDAAGFDVQTQTSSNIDMKGIKFDLIDERETWSKTHLSRKTLEENSAWYDNVQSEDFDWSSKTVAVTSLEQNSTEEDSVRLPSVDSDEIISRYGIQTDFGTLVHAFIENAVKGINTEPVMTSAHTLTESEINRLTADAKCLANGFLNSKLYESIREHELFSEREFFMQNNGIVLNGKIDLMSVCDKEVVIVDFKTDSYKNEKQHVLQLSCYRDAVSSVYKGKNIRCFVVYLRDADNPVEV